MSAYRKTYRVFITSVLSKIAVLLFALLSHPLLAQETGIEKFGSDKDGVRHVNANEAAEILKQFPSVKVLDVRTGLEYKLGHLPDSTNINYYSFSFEKQLDNLDKSITWLVHCRTGVRSGKSLPIMKSLGFESIIHLDGGIVAWTDDGQAVQK